MTSNIKGNMFINVCCMFQTSWLEEGKKLKRDILDQQAEKSTEKPGSYVLFSKWFPKLYSANTSCYIKVTYSKDGKYNFKSSLAVGMVWCQTNYSD